MDVRGVSEGGASIPGPSAPRGPFPPPPDPRRGALSARAPRDFASETFRGFCGRARGTLAEGCVEAARGRGERGEGEEGKREREKRVEERVGWEDNSIPVN